MATSGRQSASFVKAGKWQLQMRTIWRSSVKNSLETQTQKPFKGLPDPSSTGAWQVTVEEVLEAVRTFPSGSAGGPDEFRPGHLLELVGSGDGALPLDEAVTDFTNLLLRGECPPTVRPILFGGSLIVLNKDSGASDQLQSDIHGGDWRPNAQTGMQWPDCQPISHRCSWA